MNRLYYGDNLDVLRGFEAASVDLVYLDPPFNSNASYNILFKSPAGQGADASIEAFDDTWTWGPSAEDALLDINGGTNFALQSLLAAMERFIGKNAMMAYLAMMAVRLVELHRVLKPSGSLYLHCDPTASHYLKLVLDAVFGPENYRNEIIWKRTSSHGNVSANYGDVTDTIFYFSRGPSPTWNRPRMPLSEKNVATKYTMIDEAGRRFTTRDLRNPGVRPNLHYEYKGYQPHPNGWSISREKMERYDLEGRLHFPKEPSGRIRMKLYLDETEGRAMQTLWDDIPPINSQAQERLGYPTQKPIALLERIIAASSNPGDVVLDPFCGCGTAVDAAQKLGRQWIGIDITHLAIGLIEKRLREGYGDAVQFETIGVPKDKDSALKLAEEKPHEFQNWFCLKIGGFPLDGGRKGADKGVDGHFNFFTDARTTRPGVISVKAGRNIGVAMLRDLRGVMERDKYELGLFLSAYEPTGPMKAEAAAAGKFECEFGRFDRVQIVTPADIFHNNWPKLPPLAGINRKAARVDLRPEKQAGAQRGLDL